MALFALNLLFATCLLLNINIPFIVIHFGTPAIYGRSTVSWLTCRTWQVNHRFWVWRHIFQPLLSHLQNMAGQPSLFRSDINMKPILSSNLLASAGQPSQIWPANFGRSCRHLHCVAWFLNLEYYRSELFSQETHAVLWSQNFRCWLGLTRQRAESSSACLYQNQLELSWEANDAD